MQKRKWVLASLATSVVGLAIWALATPAIAGELFGRGAYEVAYSWPIFRFFGLPSLALVSAVVGYIFLRGILVVGNRPRLSTSGGEYCSRSISAISRSIRTIRARDAGGYEIGFRQSGDLRGACSPLHV